ncbi:MAG: VWA domain-containing protein [Rubripirellula sp.]|nr:VWA domain-containing protein [Rubripirellula sp.]
MKKSSILRFLAICVLSLISLTQVGANDVVFRSLVAPSETTRFREINRLEQNVERLTQSLDSVVEAIERHGEDASGERPPEASTVALCELIGRLKTVAAQSALVRLVKYDRLEVSMLAIGQLGHHQYTGSIDDLKDLPKREAYLDSYAYRFSVIRSLIEMKHPDATEALLSLRRGLDGQLVYHLDCYFDEQTLDDFNGDEKRFELFSKRVAESEELQNSAPTDQPEARLASVSGFRLSESEPESLQRMRLAPQQYYGIEIHSKRLLFILDHSSSMKDPWYGMPRLDRAKGELIKAIRALPGDVEFGIVAFHTRVHQWNNGLVEATVENKDLAIEFVRGLGYGDRTNTYGALRTALDYDADLEAVYLLTDGKPTIGELVSHQSILMDILHRNRFRHLNLNTIGVAVDGFTQGFLKRLADESGGQFRLAR